MSVFLKRLLWIFFNLQTQPTSTNEVKANQQQQTLFLSFSLSLSRLTRREEIIDQTNARERESIRKRKPEGSYERVNQAAARKKRTRV
jgi:hypothetical protein